MEKNFDKFIMTLGIGILWALIYGFIIEPSYLSSDVADDKEYMTIQEAILTEGFSVKIVGSSIKELQIITAPIKNEPCIIIPAGTVLDSKNVSVQDLIVTKTDTICYEGVRTGFYAVSNIQTACLEMDKDAPNYNDTTYNILNITSDSELNCVVNYCDIEDCPYPVKQAAVWILTNNANLKDMFKLREGFSSSWQSDDRPVIINENSVQEAIKILKKCGVDILNRRISKDFPQ